MIDTPGFDDTYRSDADILEAVAKWLHEQYQHNILLTGVIMLANVDGNRAYRSELNRTRLFKQICGQDAYKNIVIGTTMWSKIANQADGERQVWERMQSQDFWLSLTLHGTRVIPHEDNKQSAHQIIQMLLNNTPLALKMQRQLHTSNGWVNDTDAGRQVVEDLGNASSRDSEELNKLLKKQGRLRGQDRADAEGKIRALEQKIADLVQQLEKIQSTQVS